MDPDTPWLTEQQQRVWRAWLAMSRQLPAALQGQLQEDADLSLQDFDVLVQLTETTVGKVRVSDLAKSLSWERSRLSHHIRRMEGRGLVNREECPDDGRGAFVVLLPKGRDAIEHAAAAHALTVRHLFFDGLNDLELETLDALARKVLRRLESADS